MKKDHQIIDPLCAMAGKCAVELINDEVNAALTDEDWAAVQDINLDEWFYGAIQRTQKSTKGAQPRRALQYAAAVLIFMFIASALVFANAEPAKAALVRFIVKRFPQYSEYFVRPQADEAEYDGAFRQPRYIPDGFVQKELQDSPHERIVVWENQFAEQFISYHQIRGDSSTLLDTEDTTIRHISVDGIDAEMFVKNTVTTIQFFLEDSCYVVIADIPEQECIRIAESIMP